MLNHVPLGLWAVSVPFDLLGLWFGSPVWWAVSFWNVVLGLVAAAPTAVAGMIDLAALVRGPRPERLALVHLSLMLSAAGVFAVSLVVRHGPEPAAGLPRLAITGIDVLGTLLLAIGGWFGGELVYGHGAGVRRD